MNMYTDNITLNYDQRLDVHRCAAGGFAALHPQAVGVTWR